jgi:hypothetical protein
MIHGPFVTCNPNSPYTTNGKFGLRGIQNHLRKKLQWKKLPLYERINNIGKGYERGDHFTDNRGNIVLYNPHLIKKYGFALY